MAGDCDPQVSVGVTSLTDVLKVAVTVVEDAAAVVVMYFVPATSFGTGANAKVAVGATESMVNPKLA